MHFIFLQHKCILYTPNSLIPTLCFTEFKYVKELCPAKVKQGGTAEFFCRVHPADMPVTWYIQEQELLQNYMPHKYITKSDKDKRSLQIKTCDLHDSGQISVRICKKESSAQLIVCGNSFYSYV